MEMAIEAESVGRLFGSGADAVGLRELDLAVPPGSVVALLGHNGAGKTTAVRGLATLLEFDRGQARVAGFSVRSQPQEVRQRISLVGQMAAVDEHLSATDNLVLFGRLRGLNRTQGTTRAEDLLDQFGLAEARGRPVRGFSGGMRRRLDVAASIITRPEVLFVDEPTTGLDPAARRDLWQTLRGLVAEGTTILLTTQYLEEADALADHIVLLAHGAVIAEGTSDALKDALGQSRITVRFATHDQAHAALPLLSSISDGAWLDHDATLVLDTDRNEDLLASLRVLSGHGVAPVEASLRRPSLDDVFLTMTENPTPKEST